MALDAAGALLVQHERDLELGVGGPAAGEQRGGNAGGRNAEDRLAVGLQMAVDGAVEEGLPPDADLLRDLPRPVGRYRERSRRLACLSLAVVSLGPFFS